MGLPASMARSPRQRWKMRRDTEGNDTPRWEGPDSPRSHTALPERKWDVACNPVLQKARVLLVTRGSPAAPAAPSIQRAGVQPRHVCLRLREPAQRKQTSGQRSQATQGQACCPS